MDELERQYENRLVVIRINAQEDSGRELAPYYGFQYTPTFVFFNADGDELWREISNINPERVRDSVE